jgi:hypothetical protein
LAYQDQILGNTTATSSAAISTIASSFAASKEAQNTTVAIFNLYETVLGRAPDASGYAFWVNAAQTGTSLVAIANAFVTSAEFTAAYPTGTANGTIISAFYNHGLARAADTGGYNYWTAQLTSGTSLAAVAYSFAITGEALSATSVAGIRAYTFDSTLATTAATNAGSSAITLGTSGNFATYVTTAAITSSLATANSASGATTSSQGIVFNQHLQCRVERHHPHSKHTEFVRRPDRRFRQRLQRAEHRQRRLPASQRLYPEQHPDRQH